MDRFEATFDIDSKSDAYASHRILEQVSNAIREESRNVREGADDATPMLESFGRIRDAAERPAPGTLTITYERDDDAEFDG